MFVALIAGFLVWSTIAVIERKKDSEIGGWQSFTLVLVPALTGAVLTFGLALTGLIAIAPLVGLLLYLFAPLFMLRFQYEYSWGRSFAYAGIVVCYALLAELVLALGFAQVSA